jgi:hypothetical protein
MYILNETGAMDLGLNSVKHNDELGVVKSIDFLTERGTKHINKRLEPDAKKAVIRIRDIGNAAVLQKMEIGALLSLFSLGKMAEAAKEQEMSEISLSILYSLCTIGKAAVGQKMESAVRVAVSYLGEIANSASLLKTEKESLAAALAIGSIGNETFKQQSIIVPENGAFPLPVLNMLASQPQVKEATILPKELPGNLGLLIQQPGETIIPQHTSTFSEDELSYTGFSDFENMIMRAANSLGVMVFESKSRHLMSHLLMTKLALENLDGSEYTNEAESLD